MIKIHFLLGNHVPISIDRKRLFRLWVERWCNLLRIFGNFLLTVGPKLVVVEGPPGLWRLLLPTPFKAGLCAWYCGRTFVNEELTIGCGGPSITKKYNNCYLESKLQISFFFKIIINDEVGTNKIR